MPGGHCGTLLSLPRPADGGTWEEPRTGSMQPLLFPRLWIWAQSLTGDEEFTPAFGLEVPGLPRADALLDFSPPNNVITALPAGPTPFTGSLSALPISRAQSHMA